MRRTLLFYFLVVALFLIMNPMSAFATVRSLSFGTTGSDVVELQMILIAKGYLSAGMNTGYFGPLTETAIKKFQCATGIMCAHNAVLGYGMYGPKTRGALLGNLTVVSSSTSSVSTNSPLEFSGWIPYWRSATGTRDVLPHLTQLKSVMPFGYTMKNNGTLADTAHLREEPWTSFIAEAKKQKVRVIPSIMWGDGDAIHAILSNTKTRIALEDEIANMVKKNGFDGIDIDFEAKKHETIDYFSTFLKGLYQRMGNKWVYCTIEARMPLSHRYSPDAIIPPDAQDYANDYVALNKYCDRVEIMAYDQGTIDVALNKVRPSPYAPIADPEWVESLVTLAAQDIAKSKIIIGVPTYGYEYRVTRDANGKFTYKVLWPFNYRYATDIASKLGITPTRNSANEIGFKYDPKLLEAIAPEGNDSTLTQQAISTSTDIETASSTLNSTQTFNYLSWSDAKAIADKVALARKLGVRGVAVFKFDGGEDPAMWEVLK